MKLMIANLIIAAVGSSPDVQTEMDRRVLDLSRLQNAQAVLRLGSVPARSGLSVQQKSGSQGMAVYIVLEPSGIWVPMAGGGASGCFNVDLKERIERLKEQIEKFPTKEKKPSNSVSRT